MTDAELRRIYQKTNGHCHFCGDRIFFSRRGWDGRGRKGFWEVDHVIQLHKGGASNCDNYLPACTRCNRLRWHRKGREMRKVILLGLIALDQVKQRTEVGQRLRRMYKSRLLRNKSRRGKAKGASA